MGFIMKKVLKDLLINILFILIFSITIFTVFITLILGIDNNIFYLLTLVSFSFLFYLCYGINNYLFNRV